MIKLKKLIAGITALVMVLSMTACGSSSNEAASSTSSASAESETAATESTAASETASEASASAESSDTVQGALEGVTLSFGTTGLFGPFSYYDDDGTTLIGFDLDFFEALKEYLGFTQDGDIQVMDYSALTTSLAENKVDIGMAALCATDERKEVMNFTETYCDSGLTLAINTETSPSELTDVSLLEGGDYTVAVEKGTASHLYLTNAGVPTDCIEVHDTITTAYESLEQGKVDCLIQDVPGMAFYINTAEDTKLQAVGDAFYQGQSPYAIAVSFGCTEENEGIIEILNQAIQELVDNGTFAELSAKWLE